MRTFIIILLAVVVLFTASAVFLFDKNTINAWEIRWYVGMGFSMMLVLSFGVLRLYNSAVVNSRYLGTLTTAIRNKLIPALNKLGISIDRADKSTQKTDKLNRSIEELNKILNRKKSENG